MSFEPSSFLGILSAVVLTAIVLLLFRKPALVRVTTLFLNSKSRYKNLLIASFFFISTLISIALNINQLTADQAIREIDRSNGDNVGVVYRFNKEKLELNPELIFSKISDQFSSYLPVKIQEINLQNQKILLTSFDIKSARNYSQDLNKIDEKDLEINEKEIIISQEISDLLNKKAGEKVVILDKEFTIKNVIPDNDVLGYDFPIESKFSSPNGSIYLSSKNIPDAQGIILLKRKTPYIRDDLSRLVNERLQKIDNDLVFEETSIFVTNKAFGSADGVNIGQLILIYGAVVSIPVIVGIFYFLEKLKESRFLKLNHFRILSMTTADLTFAFIGESALYALITSIIGWISGYGLAVLILSGNLGNSFGIVNNFSISPDTLLIGVSTCWMIQILLIAVISLSYVDFPTSVSSNWIKNEFKVFRFKDFTITYIIAFGGFVLMYYALGGYIHDKDLYSFMLILGFDVLLASLFYLASQFWKAKKRAIFVLLAVLLIVESLWNYSTDLHSKVNGIEVYDFLRIYIGSILLIVSNISLITSILKFLRLRLVTFFAFSFFQKYIQKNFFYLLILTFLFGVLTFIPIIRHTVTTISENTQSEYDVLITDKTGREDLDSKLTEFKSQIKKINILNYGNIRVGDKKISELKGYDPLVPNSEKDLISPDIISTLNSDFGNDLNVRTEAMYQQKLDNFSTSEKYVLLGQNYLTESDIQNLHPEFSLGDSVQIEFPNGLKIEREVVGFVQDKKTSRDAVLNGVFISSADYANLRKQSVFLSSAYAVKLKDSSQAQDFISKFKLKNEEAYISQVTTITSSLTQVFKFFDKIILFLRITILAVITLLTLILIMSSKTALDQELNYSSVLAKFSPNASALFSFIMIVIAQLLAYSLITHLWRRYKENLFNKNVNLNFSISNFDVLINLGIITLFIILSFFLLKFISNEKK